MVTSSILGQILWTVGFFVAGWVGHSMYLNPHAWFDFDGKEKHDKDFNN